jgi:hypothetical protein
MLRLHPDLTLLAVAGACLWLGLLLSQAKSTWSLVGRALLIAAAASIVGAVIAVMMIDQEALGNGATLLIVTAGAALSWHLLHARDPSSRWDLAVVGASVSLLLAWAARIGWHLPTSSQNVPRAWANAAHLLLALACGAFIEQCSTGAAQWRPVTGVQASADIPQNGLHGVQCGAIALALLAGSLLTIMVGNLFITGASWSWSTAEAWTLVLLLWQTASWWGSALLHWRGPGMTRMHSLGLLVTFVTLFAVVG